MNPRRLVATLAVALIGLALVAPARAGAGDARRQREARALVERACTRLAHRTIDERRMAIADLERATLLDPTNPDVQLLLARTYYGAGFLRAASQRFECVVALKPDDARARYGLAQTWRRDWLKYVDSTSLVRAVSHLEAATRLDTGYVDAWLMLSSLRIERHDPDGALGAARRAYSADPARVEALLARGAARWRTGDVPGADHDLRIAVLKLPARVRERFEDFAPIASERDTFVFRRLPHDERIEFERRFWKEHDPDLSTRENEAQLEYWARVAQAYFLFYDPKHQEWDERGEVYVRYGAPERVEYNPIGAWLFSSVGQASRTLYPMNVLMWSYPSLGMSVALQDRVLGEYYQLPMTYDHDPDPRPDPDSLAHLAVVGTHELRGVFPILPPRAVAVPVQGQIARFVGAQGPRLFAALEAASTPGDSLEAQMVVLDSTEHEVARERGTLAPSSCDAEHFRVAGFDADLPPGRYHVGMSVRAGARRGSVRAEIEVAPPPTALALSDVVVTCGTPAVPGPAVRLDANPTARVPAGAPLTAYFEVYHLAGDDRGASRFEYVYRVVSAARDPRVWIARALLPRSAGPGIEASRVEENVGDLRRQFVSVPVQSLPAGRYRLEIRVRDLVSGTEVSGSAEFTRLPPAMPQSRRSD